MTYIFLTSSIARTGGAQIYISRKTDHLKQLGWDVHIFSVRKNDIYLENLRPYKDGVCEYLTYRFISTHPIVRKKFLSFIKAHIAPDSKIIIESHSLNFALWGEYIAKELKAINIYYDLDENHVPLSDKFLNFLKHKYNQKCLYGITKKTVPLMGFEDKTNQTWLVAAGCTSEVVQDIQFTIPDEIVKSNFRILSFGNLGKHYISNMIDEIICFAKNHSNKTIGVILTGYTKGNIIQESHKSKLENIPNIHCILVPMMYPVPLKIFEISDICVSCSGCARISWEQGLPTITMDLVDYQAIGFLHETTDNIMYRTIEPPIRVYDLLEESLIDKKYQKREIIKRPIPIDYSHHDRLLNLQFDGKYYNLSLLSNWKNKIAQILNWIFGYETVTSGLMSLIGRLAKKQ